MSVRIQLRDNSHLTLISVYAPTMQRSSEEKEDFYGKLGTCISAVANDSLIIMGDFNARVGKDWTSWPNVICKHGVGNMNSNGLMLLDFCTRFQLSIMGTMFQLKNILKYTWQHLRSKHWQQIDHVLSNQVHYSDQSQSCSRLLYRLQTPRIKMSILSETEEERNKTTEETRYAS